MGGTSAALLDAGALRSAHANHAANLRAIADGKADKLVCLGRVEDLRQPELPLWAVERSHQLASFTRKRGRA